MPVGKKGPVLRPTRGRASGLGRLLTPTAVGTLTAASFAAAPRLASVPARLVESGVPPRLYALLVGFILGFGAVKSSAWLRWKALEALFNYHGWIYNQRSIKTKVWGVLVKFLSGSGSQSTYEYQSILPHQRVPDLDHTLDRYLEVAQVLLPEEDYEVTAQNVEDFRGHEAPRLQKHLEKRAAEKNSWLSEYWLAAAYLSNRDPIAINSNFGCCNGIPIHRCHSQLSRAAEFTHNICRFFEKLKTETLQPVKLLDIVPLCVKAYRLIFNSVRIPGEFMDVIKVFPNHHHVVVLRKGHYFTMDMYAEDNSGQLTLLSSEELRNLFSQICAIADEAGPGSDVAVLTTQKRDVWAKQYNQLRVLNEDTVAAIETCMFMIILEDHVPKDASDHAGKLLVGAGSNRWFDKVCTAIFFDTQGSDVSYVGANVEHSSVDATYIVEMFEQALAGERFQDGDIICDPAKPARDLPMPERLTWNLEGMEENVKRAKDSFSFMAQNLNNYSFQTVYGKNFIKKQRLSPDGYIQMAIQLAYYRQHKEIPKTYEPATGRLFLEGRTETVHPASSHSCAFVKAMDDPAATPAQCRGLLQKAVKHQTQFRLDATAGRGCDRHLLGLYCAARELGMDVPRIFLDKLWQMPFKLSTSQTPTQLPSLGVEVDTLSNGGIFGPVCQEGYGVCYVSASENFVGFNITNWKLRGETDSVKLGKAICQAMEDMKKMLLSNTS